MLPVGEIDEAIRLYLLLERNSLASVVHPNLRVLPKTLDAPSAPHGESVGSKNRSPSNRPKHSKILRFPSSTIGDDLLTFEAKYVRRASLYELNPRTGSYAGKHLKLFGWDKVLSEPNQTLHRRVSVHPNEMSFVVQFLQSRKFSLKESDNEAGLVLRGIVPAILITAPLTHLFNLPLYKSYFGLAGLGPRRGVPIDQMTTLYDGIGYYRETQVTEAESKDHPEKFSGHEKIGSIWVGRMLIQNQMVLSRVDHLSAPLSSDARQEIREFLGAEADILEFEAKYSARLEK